MTQTSPLANESATGLVPYDVAEHLRTPEEMAAYLDAWLEQAPDDVGGLARALGDIARAKALGLRLHACAAAVEE
jgi:DNA-binding phage protein